MDNISTKEAEMSGTSGGDPYRYTHGTMPSTAQGQADKAAYENTLRKPKPYSYPNPPTTNYGQGISPYLNKPITGGGSYSNQSRLPSTLRGMIAWIVGKAIALAIVGGIVWVIIDAAAPHHH